MKTPEEILSNQRLNISEFVRNGCLKAMDEYARAKWDQACEEQRDRCVAQFINSIDVRVNQFTAREYCAIAPKPEFNK
jgi:hypothetical protein